ncbi:hypothetical protein VTN00DRAFT_5891 [Thermoascus crustaceus]|uniref:uncharacterized protein n=1 Tax=Thermoascus crustaceus TaxID=5088 RepID=UPI0037421BCA
MHGELRNSNKWVWIPVLQQSMSTLPQQYFYFGEYSYKEEGRNLRAAVDSRKQRIAPTHQCHQYPDVSRDLTRP